MTSRAPGCWRRWRSSTARASSPSGCARRSATSTSTPRRGTWRCGRAGRPSSGPRGSWCPGSGGDASSSSPCRCAPSRSPAGWTAGSPRSATGTATRSPPRGTAPCAAAGGRCSAAPTRRARCRPPTGRASTSRSRSSRATSRCSSVPTVTDDGGLLLESPTGRFGQDGAYVVVRDAPRPRRARPAARDLPRVRRRGRGAAHRPRAAALVGVGGPPALQARAGPVTSTPSTSPRCPAGWARGRCCARLPPRRPGSTTPSACP